MNEEAAAKSSDIARSGGPAVRWLRAAPPVAFAVLLLVEQLHRVFRGAEAIDYGLAIDDTYYYLQTAWNHSRTGIPTFDGLHRTNGVQFLWYWITVAIAVLSSSREQLLERALVVCSVLNAISFAFVWRIGRAIGGTAFVVVAACSWYRIVRTGYYLSGMENSLHALLLWWLADRALLAMLSGTASRRGTIAVALLSVLAVSARLDSVLVVTPLAAVLAWRTLRSTPRGERIRGLWPAAAIASFGALALFGGNYWMGRSFIPVSGLVKAALYHWQAERVPWLAGRVVSMAFQISGLTALWIAVAAGAALIVARLIAPAAHRVQGTPESRSFSTVVATFTFGSAIYLAYLCGVFDVGYLVWYYSPVLVTAALLGGWAAESVAQRLLRLGGRWGHVAAAMALGPLLVVTGSAAVRANRLEYRLADPAPSRARAGAYHVGKWIREKLPKESLLGAWKAGALGFYSERRTVNLDGLVNTPEFARRSIRDRRQVEMYFLGVDLTEVPAWAAAGVEDGDSNYVLTYLEEQGVDFLVDVDLPEWARSRWPLLEDPDPEESWEIDILDLRPK